MTEVFQSLLIPTGIFLASTALAWGVFQIRHRLVRRRQLALKPAGPLLIKTRTGIYRSHFEHAEAGQWVISAPLSRDNYVPLQPGEEVLVDAPVEGGALLFRTKVLSRDARTHLVTIGLPERLHLTERREARRLRAQDLECQINGVRGRVLNHSAEGALILSSAKLAAGDLVIVQVGERGVRGDVLDSLYEAFGDIMGGLTRVRFHEPTRLFELR